MTLASALKRLGYRARLRRLDPIDYFPKVLDKKTRPQADDPLLRHDPGPLRAFRRRNNLPFRTLVDVHGWRGAGNPYGRLLENDESSCRVSDHPRSSAGVRSSS